MKQTAMVVGLSGLGVLFWLLAYRLSPDALAMAIGLLFGALLCVPTLLLLLSSQHRQARREDDDGDDTPVVYITYNVTNNADNRQLTVNTDAATMPLLADRQCEIQMQGRSATASRFEG